MRTAKITSSVGLHKISKIQRNRLYDIVYLTPTPRPASVEFSFKEFTANITIEPDIGDFLSGRRALVAVSKNNDLRWIKDWAKFHSIVHGADAVLLFDNASTAYSPQDIHNTLSGVCGIKKVIIVSAPFKYGPQENRSKEKFLQEALLNLGRMKFLVGCKSVLSIDIDELVLCKGGKSIFNMTESSIFGYSLFYGSWRYTSAPGPLPLHKDHYWQLNRTNEKQRTKYCISPQGRFGSKSWSVHGIRGIPRWLQRIIHARSAEYLHCRQITTNWNYNRFGSVPTLVKDIRAVQVFRKVYREP